jgi:hypothetical protein
MRRTVGWLVAAGIVGSSVWACSGSDTNPFADGPRGGQSSTGGSATGGGGSSSGSSSGGATTGGASGSSSGGDATGGATPTGGTTGDGGAAAESGTESGGATMAGMGGTSGTAGMGGNAGTPALGGAGMGGKAGTPAIGGAGMSGGGAGGAGAGGAGMGGAGTSGSGGTPGGCKVDGDCGTNEYCKKESCAAEEGRCQPRGPECRGTNAVFDPVCGCDGITYWNTCVIEHEGFNAALHGECTGSSRPTCTRDGGGDSCPTRLHAHCYRPVTMCGNPSPTMGVCWVLPDACPANEPQTQRYCGGTAGSMRCIGLCEVIDAENSFDRDAPLCAATTN